MGNSMSIRDTSAHIFGVFYCICKLNYDVNVGLAWIVLYDKVCVTINFIFIKNQGHLVFLTDPV